MKFNLFLTPLITLSSFITCDGIPPFNNLKLELTFLLFKLLNQLFIRSKLIFNKIELLLIGFNFRFGLSLQTLKNIQQNGQLFQHLFLKTFQSFDLSLLEFFNPYLECILHISYDWHGFFNHRKLFQHPLSNCLETFNFLNLIVAFLLNKHGPTLGGLFLTQQPF